ncbi:hypothetical protein HCDG_07223 [Histoplasma capsulatum H143]|uniref:Uncharacterized protein n=1 Tax=Ajellomyces capsulatus (strain H143) TaxID=544712 RepID=C6HMA7_AJECH|nr:hypothetical protein HCDG_07223 [Histoplasma capsulatum H143]
MDSKGDGGGCLVARDTATKNKTGRIGYKSWKWYYFSNPRLDANDPTLVDYEPKPN